MTSSVPTGEAPRYHVPNHPIITVEHPFVVKNVDKAINMLGGQDQLSEHLSSGKSLPLSFKPNDPAARTVMSSQTSTNNVLLRITVPKRIGKRKRGSDDPYTPTGQEHPVMRDAQYLIQSMRDNKEKCRVEAVGNIDNSHVWRALPDFDYSIRGLTFLSDVQSKILPQTYPKLKEWQLPRTFGLQSTETAPPPTFTSLSLPREPVNLHTAGNEAVDTASFQELPKPESVRQFIIRRSDVESYPTSLPDDAPSLELQSLSRRNMVTKLRALFKDRPIWTRRALANFLPGGRITEDTNFALGYVAFFILKGPWSSTFCIFGTDPRKDRQCRKYQTMVVMHDQKKDQPEKSDQLPDDKTATALILRSHNFTGQGPLVGDGSTYQFCDLEDPQLKSLVDVDESQLSPECDTDFGWYGNGTITKIRLILRLKLNALRSGSSISDEIFEQLVTYPERVDVSKAAATKDDASEIIPMPESASALQRALAKTYREGCRNQGRFKVRLVGKSLEAELDLGPEERDSDESGFGGLLE